MGEVEVGLCFVNGVEALELVGVGVGVGVGDVRVVWGGIVDELMNEELLMGSVESETV